MKKIVQLLLFIITLSCTTITFAQQRQFNVDEVEQLFKKSKSDVLSILSRKGYGHTQNHKGILELEKGSYRIDVLFDENQKLKAFNWFEYIGYTGIILREISDYKLTDALGGSVKVMENKSKGLKILVSNGGYPQNSVNLSMQRTSSIANKGVSQASPVQPLKKPTPIKGREFSVEEAEAMFYKSKSQIIQTILSKGYVYDKTKKRSPVSYVKKISNSTLYVDWIHNPNGKLCRFTWSECINKAESVVNDAMFHNYVQKKEEGEGDNESFDTGGYKHFEHNESKQTIWIYGRVNDKSLIINMETAEGCEEVE